MTIIPDDGWTLVGVMAAITACQVDPTCSFPQRPACRAILADTPPAGDDAGLVLMAGDLINADSSSILGSGENLYVRALRPKVQLNVITS